MEANEVYLRRHPEGALTEADFGFRQVAIAPLAPGEVLLQNLSISIDPYIRLRLAEAESIGQTVLGGGLARILESRAPEYKSGQMVRHRAGFRDVFVSPTAGLTLFTPRSDLSITAQLHALGGIGLCAYGGLIGIGRLREGEQVFVSSAAGAVGSLAVQIAKVMGCNVVGSTGTDDKAAWLRDALGVDAAINYRTSDIVVALKAVTPKGLDVYFDNVGGAHLQAALACMNTGGRIPVCGMISGYNGKVAPILMDDTFIMRRILMKGFGFNEFEHLKDAFEDDMARWLKAGSIVFHETVFEGIESAPKALIALFEGKNTGKMLVQVQPFEEQDLGQP